MAKYKFQKFENNKLSDLDLDAKTLDGNGTSNFVGNVSITEDSTTGDEITITKVDGTVNNITIKNAYHSTSSDFAGESQYSDKSGDSDQLGGKNASEYLTGITKDQVITALGYTPLQSETKSYQHNIKIQFTGGYVLFSFINTTSTSYSTLTNILSAMTSLGINLSYLIMASGNSDKVNIWSYVYARVGNLTLGGMNLSGDAVTKEITTATSITDRVFTI